MTAATAERVRTLPVRSRVADARDELEAHRQEALALVDDCWPIVSALEVVAREVGPQAYQLTLRLGRLLARYESRHVPLDPQPAEAAA